MSLQPQDISRAANSLVAEFGKEAEATANRQIICCTKEGWIVQAGIWKEVRTAIAQIRANKAKEAGSAGRERSNESSTCSR